jgi:predicted AlkP superfamily phosphohydrolase/phosphomutase
MGLSSLSGRHLVPFWKSYAEAGNRVGILGVPFMPFIGISNGFEISDAEPYFSPEHQTSTNAVTTEMARQAFSHGRVLVSACNDYENLQELATNCLEGAGLRGDLAECLLKQNKPDLTIIVFTEAHESAHCFWQTVEPDHELFANGDFKQLGTIRPTVKEIYQAIDRQIARLIEVADPETTVVVFSLHGMIPALSVPAFLGPLMCEAGFAKIAEWKEQSWRERALTLVSTVKRRTPATLKGLYYKSMPRRNVLQWAGPTLLPRYDWKRTRAFPLVVEQHGSIRINLRGREAKGIVPVEEYEQTCREVQKWLEQLCDRDGNALANSVTRTADNVEQALSRRLPDIVVHWTNAAFKSPVRIKDSTIESYPEGLRYLGQHTYEGFCIVKTHRESQFENTLAVKDLGRLIMSYANQKV